MAKKEKPVLAKHFGIALGEFLEWQARLDASVLFRSAKGDKEPHEHPETDQALMQAQEAFAHLAEVVDAIGVPILEAWAKAEAKHENATYATAYPSAIREMVAAFARWGSGEAFRNGEGAYACTLACQRLAHSSCTGYPLEGLARVLDGKRFWA